MLVVNSWYPVDSHVECFPAHATRLPVVHLSVDLTLLGASGLILVRLPSQSLLLFDLNLLEDLYRSVIAGL